MGHQGFNKSHGRGRRGPGPWGPWTDFGRSGHQGPPPWVAGLFGLAQGDQRRGPRARRGDVRSAILDVLRSAADEGEQVNGYQVIQQIAERTEGAWKPSPGSVYPTISQLEDEGLVIGDDERGRRTLRLTDEGRAWCDQHADEIAAVWEPFGAPKTGRTERGGADYSSLKPEIGQVMSAVWQIVTGGSDAQRRAAIDVLVEARRKLYGILAEGPEPRD